MVVSNKVGLLRKELNSIGADLKNTASLIISPANRFYLSNFCSSTGYILIGSNFSYLFLDARYYCAALDAVKSFGVICTKDFTENLLKIAKAHKLSKIFIETDYVTLSLAGKLETALNGTGCSLGKENYLDQVLSKIRAIKSTEEILKIKRSQEITETSFNHILNYIKPGISEREIATELEFFAKKNGASSAAFDLIVASGKNSAVPHSSVSDKRICDSDIVLLDVGFEFDGYMSDMSRTIFVGQPSIKQKEVYNLVLSAQKLAISEVKPGATCKRIDAVVRNFIDSSKYPGTFLHSIGHGVGIEIHEKPFVSKNSEETLKPGMVVTIEPGVYIKNEFGIRIEDMLLVTKDGCENLTVAPKEILIL